MQLLMGEAQVVILCQSGQENECLPLSSAIYKVLSDSLGVGAVVMADDWKNAGSQDAVSFYEAISNAKVTVSLFAKSVDKTSTKPGDTIWKRIDEYAWYHCLTHQGPPQQRPKYIPICLQNDSKEVFANHLRTLRLGRLAKDWSSQLYSKPKSEWRRSIIENIKAIIRALNNALSTKITFEEFMLCVFAGPEESGKTGAHKPQSPLSENLYSPEPVATPVENDYATIDSATPLISCDHSSSSNDCTVRVTCTKLNNISIAPDKASKKTVVSMNVTL